MLIDISGRTAVPPFSTPSKEGEIQLSLPGVRNTIRLGRTPKSTTPYSRELADSVGGSAKPITVFKSGLNIAQHSQIIKDPLHGFGVSLGAINIGNNASIIGIYNTKAFWSQFRSNNYLLFTGDKNVYDIQQ